MPNYTVQSGDTLSAIAKRLGVPTNSISGYKSGNPNLIYAGENLTYGTPQAAPVSAQATPVEAATNGMPTMEEYLTKARSEVEPLYKPIEEQTSAYYDTLRQQLAKNIQDEYARRGILDSGLYGESYAKGETESARNKASALSELALKKLGYVQDMANSRYSNALKSWQTIQDEARAEKEYQRQLALANTKATSSGSSRSSGGSKPSATELKNSAKQELVGDVNAYIKSNVWKTTRFDTEKSFIPALIEAYPEFSADEITKLVYQLRKPYE